MSKKERWLDIEGWDGKYQVSNNGNVRSLFVDRSIHGRIKRIYRKKNLKVNDNGNGYKCVCLSLNRKRKSCYVHILVAEAFLEKTEGRNYVNHKDFNRSNNNVNNLEWCTQKENIRHSAGNMKKQHFGTKTNTGERYITKRAGRNTYRVSIPKYKIDKSFKNLENAIIYRDEVLNEINYTI